MDAARRSPHFSYSAWLLCGLISLGATLLHATPQTGWWWNPNEGGRGFFLEVQGPRMFMAGYFYSDDGRATWLASNDPMPDPNFYQGRLLGFRHGQTLAGGYRPPDAALDAGPVTIRFTDASHGTLTWVGRDIPIERYRYQRGANAAFQPVTGWWWNPAESGRGFSIEMQGDHMFIGAYMYDAAGNPIWYVADGFMETPGRFRGGIMQFANGQTQGGAYRAPTSPDAVGNITVDFSSPGSATVSLSNEKSSGKTITSIPITPFYVAAVPQGRSPDVWTGFVDDRESANLGPTLYQYTVTIVLMNWEKQYANDPDLATLIQYPAQYFIGTILADIKVVHHTPFCTGDVMAPLKDLKGSLTLTAAGKYTGRITQPVDLDVPVKCVFDDGSSYEQMIPVQYVVSMLIEGDLLADGTMKGSFPPNEIPELTREGSWSFRPANR